MTNRFKGEVPLALPDGRNFTLVVDQEALLEAETAYGKPLPQMLADMGQGFASATRALLWGGLRAKHPDVSLREAGAILFDHGEIVAGAMGEAIEAAFPQASAEGNGAGRPNGKTSGGNGAKPGSTRKRSGGQRPAASL